MNQGLNRPLSKFVELPRCAVTLIVIVMSGLCAGCNQNADAAFWRRIFLPNRRPRRKLLQLRIDSPIER